MLGKIPLDLADIWLSYANLEGANFAKTGLSDARLNDANLKGANIRKCELKGSYDGTNVDFAASSLFSGEHFVIC